MAVSGSFTASAARLIQAEGRLAQKLWSFADQAMVSAASFFVLFFLARHTSAADVGYYAVSISVIVIMVGIQDALVTRPYTLRYFDAGISGREHAGGTLVIALSMALLSGIFVAAIALFFQFVLARPDLARLAGALALALPAGQMREFVRRYLLAGMAVRKVFFFDLMAILAMIILLLRLGASGWLDAASALGGMALGYLLILAFWLLLHRREFHVSRAAIRHAMLICWDIGKWLLPGRAARELQGYMTHWYSIAMLSATATGVFAASLSIVALSNPFIIGMVNVMTPRAVRSLKERGMAGLRNQAVLDALFIGFVMFGFAAFIALFGEALMGLLFPDEAYAGNSRVLPILALSVAVSSTGAPAAVALMSAGHTRAESKISLGICALELMLIPLLILHSGIQGAAFALLLGEIVGFVSRWGLLAAILKRGGAGLSLAAAPAWLSSKRNGQGGIPHAGKRH